MSDAQYVLVVDIPGSPKGEGVAITGLGEFKNGSSYDISKEQADNFRALNSTQEMVYDSKTNEVLGAEMVQGPTLLQASKTMHGITVTTADKDNDEDEPDEEDDVDEEEVDDEDEFPEGSDS
jgi:hypothetical protein